jgi:hypothetical protein
MSPAGAVRTIPRVKNTTQIDPKNIHNRRK